MSLGTRYATNDLLSSHYALNSVCCRCRIRRPLSKVLTDFLAWHHSPLRRSFVGKKIFVGNLAFSATEDSISELFRQHGTVDSCRLITDRDTGRSKGFGFVEMSTNEEAASAISSLDGREVEGRPLKVNEARPKPERSFGERDSYQSSERASFGGPRRGGRSSY